MLKQATFAQTPAGKARQIYPWIFCGMDYTDLGKYMNELAGYLEGAKKVT
jgi:iron complex transport system substrate-binding protein